MVDPPRVTLRPFRIEDVVAHIAGEDPQTVRWLNEGHASTTASTTRWIRSHEVAHARRDGELVFAVERDGLLSGMVAANLDHEVFAGRPGDVNLSYCIYHWARGRGTARLAVGQLCDWLAAEGLGRRAVARVEPANTSSLRVIRAVPGFTLQGTFGSPRGVVHEHHARSLQTARHALTRGCPDPRSAVR
jgi:RimJ/RimL family protein N-acetyltransferase